jgi:hypothetical protein
VLSGSPSPGVSTRQTVRPAAVMVLADCELTVMAEAARRATKQRLPISVLALLLLPVPHLPTSASTSGGCSEVGSMPKVAPVCPERGCFRGHNCSPWEI